MSLPASTRLGIVEFLEAHTESFAADAREYGVGSIEVHFATDGDLWEFQTGDASFAGGCYQFPYWATIHVSAHSFENDSAALAIDVIDQLEDAIAEAQS